MHLRHRSNQKLIHENNSTNYITNHSTLFSHTMFVNCRRILPRSAWLPS